MNYAMSVWLLVLSGSAFATQESKIEEVIVTAEYVRKSAQKTALAITALDNKFIEDSGLTEIDDLMLFVPSMSRDALDLSIRGIGRNFRTIGGDTGVPSYLNGIYSEEALAIGSEQVYYDINRIEILRGPQGTLYGRNAIGGVVNYITNAPTPSFFAEIKTRVGAHDTGDLHTVLSGPLVKDVLAYRLVGVSVNQGPDRPSRAASGQTSISDTGGYEDNTLALTLTYTPTDNIDIMIRGSDRYYRLVPRVPVLIGEGSEDRDQRSRDVCFPEGTDCFNASIPGGFSSPPLNPNAHGDLPVNGNGYGKSLKNEAYPDFKPDYGFWYSSVSIDAQWRFNYDLMALRYLASYADGDGTYKRHDRSATGGRNSCLAPECGTGTGGEQISAYAAYGSNPFRQQSHELQFISNFDGAFNFVAGLFYGDFERELYYELADSAQLGTFSKEPSWGLLDPSMFFPAPLGLGRHNVGLNNDEARFAYFGGTSRGAWFWFDSEVDTLAIATYLQASFDLTEQLELSLGVRWSEDKKDGREWRWIFYEIDSERDLGIPLEDFNALITTDPETGAYNGDPLRLSGFPIEIVDSLRIKDSWNQPTWRVALSWTPKSDQFLYGSITTGYRSGGFNLGLHQLFPYKEELVMAYEVGFKSDFLDNTLRLNVNAYFYDYEDHQLQASQVLSTDLVGCNISCYAPGDEVTLIDVVRNVPRARNWGMETELIWRAAPYLTLGLVHSYMDTEITSDFYISRESNVWSALASTDVVNLKGGELTKAPKHKASVWANYTVPMGDRGTLNLLATYAYTDKQYFNVLNDRINEAPAYQRWDFRAIWDSPRKKYRVSAYVKNITDELGVIQLRAAENFVRTADTSRPRTWGLEFRMRFGDWSTSRGKSLLFDGPNMSR